MPLVSLTGVTVTEDEKAGLQNTGVPTLQNGVVVEANDDNDIALSNLATMPFYSELFGAGGLNLNPASVIGLAKSPGNVISIGAGAGFTNAAFTDSSGNPLVGVFSGLTTTGGAPIFLYTDPTQDDIVVGRVGTGTSANPTADPNGQVAFAVVMDETSTGGVVTGANFWVLQFDSLGHPAAGAATDGATATTPGDFDEAVNLAGQLNVTVSQQLLYSDFSKAPSGENNWLGITPTGSTTDTELLITGMKLTDVNNNQTGDVVQTSQTGVGTDSQAVNPGEGVRIDFVNGLNTAANAKDMEAINYTTHDQVHGAGFQISQVQGNSTTRVDAKVTLSETPDATGTHFVAGTANNTPVAITYVVVLDATGKVVERQNADGTNPVNDPKITITISGNVATVHGLLNGYSVVAHSGNAAFDRMTVENVTNAATGHSFDVGGISLIDAAHQTVGVGGAVNFEDSGPSVTLALTTGGEVRVNEHGLETAGSVSSTTTAASLFTGSVDYNADGPAATGASSWSLTLSLAGADSGLKDTATGHAVLLYLEGGQIVGRIDGPSGAEVFSVSIDAPSGDVTLTQFRAIVNPDPTDPVESLHPQTVAAGLISVVHTVTDGDGDTATASADPGPVLKFQDDGPSVTLGVNGTPTITVQEAGLETHASVSGSATAATLFSTSVTYGADGPAAANASTWALTLPSSGEDSGLTESLTHTKIYLYLESGAVVGRAGGPSGAEIFSVSIDSSGALSLTQYRAIDNPDATNPHDITGMAANLISVQRTVVDGDGDSKSASVSVSDLLKFQDDGPHNITPAGAHLTDQTGSADTEALNFTGAIGADVNGSIVFQGTNGSALSGSINGGAAAGLMSGGAPIYLFGFGTGVLTGTTDPTGANAADDVFTVTLNPGANTYSISMIGTIDNGDSLRFNDFSGVPSGQQQWIGLLDPRTGAANEHQDVLFTGLKPGVDTVNTSQTGIGSDNQSVDPGEAIRIDFVTNLDVGTGNLKNLSTVAFDGHYTVNHAGFEVSQTQSNAGVATRVSVYDEKDAPPDLNPATPYSASDLTDDAKKPITEITVLDSSGHVLFQGSADGTQNKITVHFLNGGTDVDVVGLKAGETVLADTADGFQRMLVQNVGSTYHISKGFDLGGVQVSEGHGGDPITFSAPLKLTDNDGDTASGAINVTLDPAPVSSAAVTLSSTVTSVERGVAPTTQHGASGDGFLLHDGFVLDPNGHAAGGFSFAATDLNSPLHQSVTVLHDSLFF